MRRALFMLAPVLLGMVSPGVSQTLVRNPQTGDYVLTYTDLNDTVRTAVIITRDKVDASLTVQVSTSGGAYVYRYALANGPTARQSIGFVDMLCPVADPTLTAAAPSSWNAKAETNGKLDGVPGWWLCSYSIRNDGAWVTPGSSLTDLRITSSWLPAARAARAFGLAGPTVLPTPVEDTPDTVYQLIERVKGFGFFSGGGFALSAVVPARPPAVLAALPAGLDSVAADRSQSCTLGWIANAAVCTSLGAKLDQARQALGQGDNAGARTQLQSFLNELAANHGAGLPVNDNAYWLLKVNGEYVLNRIPGQAPTVATLYLHGSGGTANPPTLSLSAASPTGTSAKTKDSPAIVFSGGNPWVTVGTWTAALGVATPSPLGDVQAWLGLKNSDDIGTNFDVRVEVLKNGTLVAAGQTRCVSGISNGPANAKPVLVAFSPSGSANGPNDVLALKVLTRIGTTSTGAACGGHSNATGLRLYFDATSRPARMHWTITLPEQ